MYGELVVTASNLGNCSLIVLKRSLTMGSMRSIFLLVLYLLAVATRLLNPDGVRSVIAENLLLRRQLSVQGRGRSKAPDLKK